MNAITCVMFTYSPPGRTCPHVLDVLQIESMVQDPFNFLGPVRVRTALSLLNGFKGMQRSQHRISLPIYAHHGTKDKLASLPVSTYHLSPQLSFHLFA